jgi:hypothetical protein
MFQLVEQATTAPQAAQATDGVTNVFLLLAVGAFVVVLLRLIHAGEIGSVIATVGGVITAVVVVTVIALVVFAVLLAFHALLAF